MVVMVIRKAKKQTEKINLVNHDQITLEETREKIEKVLSKLDNLEEDEGGESK